MKTTRTNGIKSFLVFLLIVCLGMTAIYFVGCDDNKEKEIQSIGIGKNPTKTEYYVGEEFSAAGGEITITYTDGTTENKSMTAEGVTIDPVNITVNDDETSSKKTVTVRYGNKGARFSITVSYQMYSVTFDHGYGDGKTVVNVNKDAVATRPETDPTREGYTFDNWFSDETRTMAFDFTREITGDTTVYAKWLENGATYYDVTFDYNYIGSVNPDPQKVKSGERATRLVADPVRTGYSFDGWVTAANGNTAFNFDGAISAAVTIYAKWTRISTGSETYVFEAEDSNLDGKVGKGLSGTAPGVAMIQRSDNLGASNDRFVGFLYDTGLALDFQVVSDSDVSDATIVFSFSAEMRDFDIDPDSILISVNYQSLQYDKISFTNVPKSTSEDVSAGVRALPFKDYTIATNVSLVEGRNFIQLQVLNDDVTEGTTMTAIAPLVDCLKITTEAVLTWDASLGLPKKNY